MDLLKAFENDLTPEELVFFSIIHDNQPENNNSGDLIFRHFDFETICKVFQMDYSKMISILTMLENKGVISIHKSFDEFLYASNFQK